ncbi:hypothetical protein B0H10DRAFT_1952203 [Mycena sp. CBHHK59/15]|nr:hypothetical protein B0H10DRAFT_1952203 [Mycena sp. CBHHK59/15]
MAPNLELFCGDTRARQRRNGGTGWRRKKEEVGSASGGNRDDGGVEEQDQEQDPAEGGPREDGGAPRDKMTAHLKWAADMKPLVKSIGDTTMLLKGDVRATLPLEVCIMLPSQGLTTWDKFFMAVEALDSEYIQDELEHSGGANRGRGMDSVDGDASALWALVPGLEAYMAEQMDRGDGGGHPKAVYPRCTLYIVPLKPQRLGGQGSVLVECFSL